MKHQIKRIVHICDKPSCKRVIEDYEDGYNEYTNVCMVCLKEFCNEHIWKCIVIGNSKEFALCEECYEKLFNKLEKYVAIEECEE